MIEFASPRQECNQSESQDTDNEVKKRSRSTWTGFKPPRQHQRLEEVEKGGKQLQNIEYTILLKEGKEGKIMAGYCRQFIRA